MNKQLIFAAFSAVVFLSVFISCEQNSTESKDKVPEVVTYEVTEITRTTATCGGNITDDGGATVTARGVCWSTGQTPKVSNDTTNNGTGAGSFTSHITGLTGSTIYYVRAYATNSAGTGYGSTMSFATQEAVTVTDIDGNVYQTVKIGDQWWMAENLKVTHYRNGAAIPLVTSSDDWSNLSTGARCAYDNDQSEVATYGYLYNWYAVDDSRNIAPSGWHVPSNAEWQTLVDYLGGDDVTGGKLKETGTNHWESPNEGATNESGFAALPGGYRYGGGNFYVLGYVAYFWSSTEISSNYAWYRLLDYDDASVYRSASYKQFGFSLRLVRD